MFSVGYKTNTGCNGVAQFGAMSGAFGAYGSPPGSPASPGCTSQDPYAFTDSPGHQHKLILKTKDRYNGHLTPSKKIINGEYRNANKTNKSIDIFTLNRNKRRQNSVINNVNINKQRGNSNNDLVSRYNNGLKQLNSESDFVKNSLSDVKRVSQNFVKETDIKNEPIEYLIPPPFSPLAQPAVVSTKKQPVKKPPGGKPHPSQLRTNNKPNSKYGYHEALQRIDHLKKESIDIDGTTKSQDSLNSDNIWHAPGTYIYDYDLITPNLSRKKVNEEVKSTEACSQKTWFSSSLHQPALLPRDLRLSLKRAVLRRQVNQTRGSLQCVVQDLASKPRSVFVKEVNASLKTLIQKRKDAKERQSARLIPPRRCRVLESTVPCGREVTCDRPAIPCTAYCIQHILQSSEQQLFSHCTAKFADNSPCSVPVFDITHELPLCREHAWKRDNYDKINAEAKPKKAPRKRPKPSAMIRPQKRNKKKKSRPNSTPKSVPKLSPICPTTIIEDHSEITVCETSSACESSEDTGIGGLSESELIPSQDQIVEHVLSFAPEIASRLLEENDFTTVLNQIPADAFEDLFAVEQGEQYEPNMQEAEELERALEAVDEEVKSLEKLTGAHGLLMDTLLDDRCLAETLAQLG